eukprot:TRINITY_DN66186_c0_g1_i1.p2 TRINITY_DN66186_c0_g1~~TRINITY_DN66186_c0_g1_i1.p2  ORF type:complete len:264 (+),score=83.30 TRINITY_DN66186_c0_g1_i1:84-875(+)
MRSAAALAALLGTAAGTVDVSVTDSCTSACKITGVTIKAPKTAPSPGSFTFSGTGTTSVAISNPTLDLTLNLGGTPVLHKDVPACGDEAISLPLGLGSVKVHGFPCPVAAGASTAISADVSDTVALPSAVTGKAVFKQGDDLLLSLDLSITPEKSLKAPADGACNDANDTKIWNATGFKNFESDMTSCGLKCLGKDTCVTSCMESTEHYTPACAKCFGDLGQCTATNCLTKCMSGRNPTCVQCLEKAGCDKAFVTCSGKTPPA